MEDSRIIGLYWERNERAIEETARKYGSFCYGVAKNILAVNEDAEECVNDTYIAAWNAIPPQQPLKLRPWLGKIVRNISLNLWNKNHAQKRYSGMTTLLSELEDCVPSPKTVEQEIEERELSIHIENWLRALKQEERVLFVRRYWYGTALYILANERGISPAKLAQRMYRLRASLRNFLEKEGVNL